MSLDEKTIEEAMTGIQELFDDNKRLEEQRPQYIWCCCKEHYKRFMED